MDPHMQFLGQPMGQPIMMGPPSGGITTSAFSDSSRRFSEIQPDSSDHAASDENQDVKSAARQWAIREGFNSEKLTEFGHLMAMVSDLVQ